MATALPIAQNVLGNKVLEGLYRKPQTALSREHFPTFTGGGHFSDCPNVAVGERTG